MKKSADQVLEDKALEIVRNKTLSDLAGQVFAEMSVEDEDDVLPLVHKIEAAWTDQKGAVVMAALLMLVSSLELDGQIGWQKEVRKHVQ